MKLTLFTLAFSLAALTLTSKAEEDVEVTTLRACPCNRMYAPVCATNGQVYGNKCTWRCAKKFHPSKRERPSLLKVIFL